ncbi:MAG: nuclear transport factor 2 family protein [Candidatus Thermoplasmatota archaeon]|jgi:ketosteroid isomerase-like protein|nr:nuclear transport factor 2 family protein [Candidatus Thermoplasmatota archaeon]MCL5988314.1 nuclear transport factor 2 family protein [Candidatus Thermoplasmatota archaeon]
MESPEQFMKRYESAANSRNYNLVEEFIGQNAIFWFSDGTFIGKDKIRKAFENTWEQIKDEKYLLTNLKWIIENNDYAACVYNFRSEGYIDDKLTVAEGRGTTILRLINDGWQILHEHLSIGP